MCVVHQFIQDVGYLIILYAKLVVLLMQESFMAFAVFERLTLKKRCLKRNEKRLIPLVPLFARN